MANFRRNKPRLRTSPHGLDKWRYKDLGVSDYNNWRWLTHWPRWWDIEHHTRPRRRVETRIAHAVKRGYLDADDTVWPLDKKPHSYYW